MVRLIPYGLENLSFCLLVDSAKVTYYNAVVIVHWNSSIFIPMQPARAIAFHDINPSDLVSVRTYYRQPVWHSGYICDIIFSNPWWAIWWTRSITNRGTDKNSSGSNKQ